MSVVEKIEEFNKTNFQSKKTQRYMISELWSNIKSIPDTECRRVAMKLCFDFMQFDCLTAPEWEDVKSLLRTIYYEKMAPENMTGWYIYVFTDGAAFKIGLSSDVDKRLKTLQGSNSQPLKEVTRIFASDVREDAAEAERLIHRYLLDYRIRGEWFCVSCKDKLFDLFNKIL